MRGVPRRHLQALAQQDALTRIVYQSRPQALHSWLRRAVTVAGLEHVREAQRDGRGVIFCSLHFGAFPLIPVSLLARGYPLHGIHFAGQTSGPSVERVLDRHVAVCGWAPVVIHRVATAAVIRGLVGALTRGENVMVLPDFYPASRTAHIAAGRENASTVVSFGPHTFLAHTWVGWLSRQGNCCVVPTRCLQVAGGNFRIDFLPAIERHQLGDLPARASDAEMTQMVFRALGPDILARGEQWAFLLTHQASA